MTRQPVPLHARFAAMLSGHVTKLALHTQQITTLQSQVAATAALVPGSWETITLAGGWSNVPGAVPAQARLITSTTVQIIGNIQNGTTSDGTTIGTLTAGFFNTVHAHTFDCVCVTGAAAVPVTGALNDGTVAGASMPTSMIPTADHSLSVSLPVTLIPTGNHTISSTPFTLGPSGTQFDNIPSGSTGSGSIGPSSGVQFQNIPSGTSTSSTSVNNTATQTPVNYNKACITLGTDGSLKITNVNFNVDQLSFHEASLPLFTA